MAALPAMVIIVLAGLSNHGRAVSAAEKELLAFSRHITEVQRQTTLATQNLLEGLALLPEVRRGDVEECNRLFSSLLTINPVYAALHLVDRNGELVASASARGPVSFADTPISRKPWPRGPSPLANTSLALPCTFRSSPSHTPFLTSKTRSTGSC